MQDNNNNINPPNICLLYSSGVQKEVVTPAPSVLGCSELQGVTLAVTVFCIEKLGEWGGIADTFDGFPKLADQNARAVVREEMM